MCIPLLFLSCAIFFDLRNPYIAEDHLSEVIFFFLESAQFHCLAGAPCALLLR